MIRWGLSVGTKKSIIWGMTNLPREVCQKIRNARREAGLSQSELSAEVGCNQSALSMFEQGDGTKLNDEVIEKLAKRFEIDIRAFLKKDESESSVKRVKVAGLVKEGVRLERGFCPNPKCPSNHGYEVEGVVFLQPNREAADPVGGRFCAVCGEVLEKRCPSCGAPLHGGAVCSYCGEPYIPVVSQKQ